jgi:hypothetical protein
MHFWPAARRLLKIESNVVSIYLSRSFFIKALKKTPSQKNTTPVFDIGSSLNNEVNERGLKWFAGYIALGMQSVKNYRHDFE